MTTRLSKLRVTLGLLAGGAAAEQAILTTGAIQSSQFTPVAIDGSVNFTAGAGTTAVVVRLRRGSGLGGAQVGAACTITLAAGASATIPLDWIDTPSDNINQVGGGQYTLSIQQTGGTGNGTVNEGTMEVSQQ